MRGPQKRSPHSRWKTASALATARSRSQPRPVSSRLRPNGRAPVGRRRERPRRRHASGGTRPSAASARSRCGSTSRTARRGCGLHGVVRQAQHERGLAAAGLGHQQQMAAAARRSAAPPAPGGPDGPIRRCGSRRPPTAAAAASAWRWCARAAPRRPPRAADATAPASSRVVRIGRRAARAERTGWRRSRPCQRRAAARRSRWPRPGCSADTRPRRARAGPAARRAWRAAGAYTASRSSAR